MADATCSVVDGATPPRKTRKRIPIEERYWSKVSKEGPVPAHRPELGPCWPWTAACDKDGYPGSFWDGTYLPSGRGHYVSPARWAYERFIEPIPDGHSLLHHCDNPPCMNFVHWFTGTAADNYADMIAKGRARPARGDQHGLRKHPEAAACGETAGNARLTNEQVWEIRARWVLGESQKQLSREYGIAQPAIHRIVKRLSWKHL